MWTFVVLVSVILKQYLVYFVCIFCFYFIIHWSCLWRNFNNSNKRIPCMTAKINVISFVIVYRQLKPSLCIITVGDKFKGYTCILLIIGDDTDLLILLCWHNNLQSPFNVYLKSEQKKTLTSYECGISRKK